MKPSPCIVFLRQSIEDEYNKPLKIQTVRERKKNKQNSRLKTFYTLFEITNVIYQVGLITIDKQINRFFFGVK